ncbi:MAG: hypothetical protein IJF49_03265 [Clostridia bacterium]|nr:hypothetical protein [Clostridia bacterium]
MENIAEKLPFRLIVSTPDKAELILRCDSVSFSVPDGKDGKRGGSVGVRSGHVDAVFALAAGRIFAKVDSQTVFDAMADAGVAFVENNCVTVLTNKVEISVIDRTSFWEREEA